MKIQKLVDYCEEVINRGAVFRFPARWPYENLVDFMVFETQDDESPYGLIVSSGYKAGLFSVKLPYESISDLGFGLSTKWLIDNWAKWVYPECDVKDVYILDGYEAIPIK